MYITTIAVACDIKDIVWFGLTILIPPAKILLFYQD